MNADDTNMQGSELETLKQKYFAQIMSELDDTQGAVVDSADQDATRVAFHYPKNNTQTVSFATVTDVGNAQQSIEVSWQYGSSKNKKKQARTASQLQRIVDEIFRDIGLDSEVIYERRQHKRRARLITYCLQTLGLHTAWERRRIRLRDKKLNQ